MATKRQIKIVESFIKKETKRLLNEYSGNSGYDETDIIISNFNVQDRNKIIKIINSLGYGPVSKTNDEYLTINCATDDVDDCIEWLDHNLNDKYDFGVEIYEK